MAGVSIRIDGAEEAARAAREAARRAIDATPVWDEIGAMLEVSTRHRFDQGRSPDGSVWPPSLRVLNEGGKTLMDSGAFVGSITHIASPDGVEVGTNAIQGAVHQFGAVITAKTDEGLRFKIGDQWVRKQSVTIPQRAFLGVDQDDEAAIVEIWEDWLGEPVGAVQHAG
jgi:phage virion morphogenesis protein